MTSEPASELTFRVLGVPAPQGSKKLVAGRMVESSTILVPWRNAVSTTVHNEMVRAGHSMITGAVQASMIFLFRRPVSLPKRVIHHTKHPDLSKIIRATEDALVDAGLLRDDAQIVSFIDSRKEYARPGVAPGVWIRLVILE